jgi:pimeloyl-ACP methyl ester carboxylesterase
MEEHYGEIDMPVAVVTGSGDRLVDPRRHAFRLREELPNATLHVVEGAGHMVHYEAPDLVARAVDEVVRAAETRTPLHVAGSRPPGPFEPMHRPADL